MKLDSGPSVWVAGEGDEVDGKADASKAASHLVLLLRAIVVPRLDGKADASKAAIHDLVLLLRAILLQAGLVAAKLDTAQVTQALHSAFAFIAGAHGAGALATSVPVGACLWGAHGQRWVGLAAFHADAPSVLWLTLNAPRYPVTIQPSVSGTAKWMGREYAVRGSYKQAESSDDDVMVWLTLESQGADAISFSGSVKKSDANPAVWPMACTFHAAAGPCAFALSQVPGTGSELNVCVGEGTVEVEGGAVCVPVQESGGDPKVFLIQTTQPASPSNNYIEESHPFSDLLSSRTSLDGTSISVCVVRG